MLGRPQHAKSGDRPSEISIHGLLEQHDVGVREISCIADLIVEQLLGRVIVGQRWFYSAGKRGDAVTAFAHCSEEGVDAGHAARVATLETASFVQPLNPEDVGAVNRTMDEDHGPHARMTKFRATLRHRLEPGRRFRLHADRQLDHRQTVAGIFPRELVVLKVILDRHGRRYLPERAQRVQLTGRDARTRYRMIVETGSGWSGAGFGWI